MGYILGFVVQILVALKPLTLALAKSSNGVSPTVVGDALYQLRSKTLCLQSYDVFFLHLLPH
jgi:hypothetical protein